MTSFAKIGFAGTLPQRVRVSKHRDLAGLVKQLVLRAAPLLLH
jgi:hypothetical protein